MAGVAASCRPVLPQRQGWHYSAWDGVLRRGCPHRTNGDGGDALHWSDVMASSWASAEQTSVPFSRAPPSSFEGAVRRPYRGGWHSVTELTLALPHSALQ
jgi:hypothetical protein